MPRSRRGYGYMKPTKKPRRKVLSTRRAPLPRTRVSRGVDKRAYICRDGPWKGKKLWLATDVTMVVSCNGQRFRYIGGHVEYMK